MSLSGWNYYRAIEAIVKLARLEDRRRQVLGCSRCDALFLTPVMAPNATECGPCYRRAMREADDAADRRAYQRYLDGGGDPLSLGPPKSEPVLEPAMQGVLF